MEENTLQAGSADLSVSSVIGRSVCHGNYIDT